MLGGKRPLILLSATLVMIASSAVQAEASNEEANYEEIVVSVPFELKSAETALPIGILSGEELQERVSGSIGETLQDEIGVSSESFGPSVGRPIVRGQTGNRVKVLRNGAGVTDVSASSPDHANAIEVGEAERLEVIRGPSTLLYGSGAIGGVVNVIDDRIPERAVDRPSVTLEHSYDSVNSQNSTNGKVTFGSGPLAVYLGAFRRDGSNFEIDGSAIDEIALEVLEERLHGDEEEEGHEEEELENTRGFIGNSDSDVSGGSAGVSLTGDWGFIGISVSELDNDYGLPPGAHGAHAEDHDEDEEDHDEDEEDHDEDEEDHDEDEEDHDEDEGGHGEIEAVRLDMEKSRTDIQGAWFVNGDVVKDIRFSFGWTDYEHGEIEFFEDGDSHVGTLFTNEGVEGRATVHLDLSDAWEAVIGTQLGDTEFSAVGEEAFIPRSDIEATGLFGLARYQSDSATFEFGLRGERNRISTDGGCSSSDTSISMGASALFPIDNESKVYLSAGRSERAATVEERYSNVSVAGCGIPDDDHDLVLHAATNLVEIGAPGLDTETANNLEIGLRRDSDRYSAEVNVYLNRVSDYIFLERRGEDEDERALAFYGAQDAVFTGWEAKLETTLATFSGSELALTAFADSVRGKFTDGGNIPRLAPGKLGGGLRLFADTWGIHVHLARVMDQDNASFAEVETDGYTRLSLYGDKHWAVGGGELAVFLQGKNLLDEKIRNHASFVRNFAPDPGRNIRVGVRFTY